MERHAVGECVWVWTTLSALPCLFLRFNGRYKLWWNITSLFMSVCQHMWVERCACEELSLFKRVGGDFCMCLSVYWRICQEHLKVTKKGGKAKWRHNDGGVTPRLCLLCTLPPIHLCFLDDNLITLCSRWLQSACFHLTPDPIASQRCKLLFLIRLFTVSQRKLLVKCNFTFTNDSSHTNDTVVWQGEAYFCRCQQEVGKSSAWWQ